jgi:hypothetical protein
VSPKRLDSVCAAPSKPSGWIDSNATTRICAPPSHGPWSGRTLNSVAAWQPGCGHSGIAARMSGRGAQRSTLYSRYQRLRDWPASACKCFEETRS